MSSLSFGSIGSVLSGLSRWSLLAWRGVGQAPDERPTLVVVADEPDLAESTTLHVQS